MMVMEMIGYRANVAETGHWSSVHRPLLDLAWLL